MITRVHIKNYKSLHDVEIRLEPLTVLFGANTAGKSNFLDALQLLSRTATSRTLKEAFDPPYRGKPLESFRMPKGGIGELVKQESASFSIEVDVELGDAVVKQVNRLIHEMRRGTVAERTERSREPVTERSLRYRLEVEILPGSGHLRVRDEYLAALARPSSGARRPNPTGKRKAFLELFNDESRLHLRMEGQSHPFYYAQYLDHTILSMPHYPPHYPHLVAMKEELSRWFFYYFEPRERMRAANPVREVWHVGQMGENLAAYLNTLRATDPRRFKAVERTISKIIPSITGIEVEVNALGEAELRIREHDASYSSRIVSEGTLRLLGLLSLDALKETPALIGFEEPENGVHPRRIELIARILEARASPDTQVIATTHSPVLLDHLPPDSLYVVRRDSDGTTVSPFQPTGAMFRQHEQARDLNDGDITSTVSTRVLRGDLDG